VVHAAAASGLSGQSQSSLEEAIAVFSDVHGNLQALQAVLEHIRQQAIERIYFLGDVLGPGPDSFECLDLIVESCQIVLRGECDQTDSLGPAPSHASSNLDQKHERRRRFLIERPASFLENDFLFVHGSARNPLNEYVFPEDIYNQRKMERIFAAVPRFACMGHTHVPGIFTEDFRFLTPADVESHYRLDGRKTLCNVGSVGQPRDGDWRACYAILAGQTIHFRRVEFDLETRRGRL
jgi:predicted phosphodiesterase